MQSPSLEFYYPPPVYYTFRLYYNLVGFPNKCSLLVSLDKNLFSHLFSHGNRSLPLLTPDFTPYHVSQCGSFLSLIGQYRLFYLLSLMLMIGDIISVSVSTNQQEVYTTEQLGPSSLIHCSHSHKLTFMMTHHRLTHTESLHLSVNRQALPLH